MQYISTRSGNKGVSGAAAIISGLAPDGGLFMPESLPHWAPEEILALCHADYPGRAAWAIGGFLQDYSQGELADYCQKAYGPDRFTAPGTAPVVKISDSAYILELFHGPTCAFKDFALQLLPYLLTAALAKQGVAKTVIILVATSGDTGKAALEGFADVAGTKICVFYPEGGTSAMQRLQMTTQKGGNVRVAAVKGNFDDAQNGVKAIFTDQPYGQRLAERGYLLSSANSINWGRLAPQVAYYLSAYCDLLNQGRIRPGERINICVPTGNFGNILAAYFAKSCGLPVHRLICASNKNRVLTDFITTGVYDRNRDFYLTSSPSMDILISSNLERLLYLLAERDAGKIRGFMGQLRETGRYDLDSAMLAKLQAEFAAGSADEAETFATIRRLFQDSGYLCDTHTAVAVKVYQDYLAASGDTTPTVIAATASPFKFCGSVLPALGQQPEGDDFSQLNQLAALSGLLPPSRLLALKDQAERFTQAIGADAMAAEVDQLL